MTIEPAVGDLVYHSCNPDLHGKILRERGLSWEIEYPSTQKNGSWLKKYTRLDTKNIPRPLWAEYPNMDNWADALEYFYQFIKPPTAALRPKLNQFSKSEQYKVADDVWMNCNRKYSRGDWWPKHIPEEAEDNPKLPALTIEDADNSAYGRIVKAAEEFKQKINNENMENKMIAEIVHKTEINGRDINEMTASDILHTISNVQDRIEKMSRHKDKSKYAKQEIERLEKFVIDAYNVLDDKFADVPK